MFEKSLIEEQIKTRRGAATAVSFMLQFILVGIVVLLPLLFTQALPSTALVTQLVAPPPPPPPPPPAAQASAVRHQEEAPVKSEEMSVPVRIPQKIAMVREAPASAAAAPSTAGVVGGVPGGVEGGTIGGVVGGVLNSVGPAIPKLAPPKRVRVTSGVTEGLLIHKVVPQYPQVAKASRQQGTVVLAAVIGKDGEVKDVKLVSGSPVLAQAAMAAVRQWRYKPYYLNGQPTEVDTTINVNFKLG